MSLSLKHLDAVFTRMRQKLHTANSLPKPATTGSEIRACVSCNQEYPLADFWSAGRGKRVKECKWCKRSEAKRLYEEGGEASREKARKFQRKRRIEHPREEILRRTRNRALRSGIEFTINENDLDWPDVCPVLGVKLIYGAVGAGRALFNSASLDRVNNKKGYVPGNVRVISNRANCIKRDATLEELRLIVKYVESALSVK